MGFIPFQGIKKLIQSYKVVSSFNNFDVYYRHMNMIKEDRLIIKLFDYSSNTFSHRY